MKSLIPLASMFAAMLLLAGLSVCPTNRALAADEAAAETTNDHAKEASPPTAADVAETLGNLAGNVDVLWTCLAAFLVFFMQAGFALVECGFTRAKNACNIIMKNLLDFSIGSLLFWLVGFGLMFGANNGGYFGTDNFLFDAEAEVEITKKAGPETTEKKTTTASEAVGKTTQFGWAFLIFQTVFCATAATIVSGAMAERTKFSSYLIYSIGITMIVYPIYGSWAWSTLWDSNNEGWLVKLGFLDFAGSTVVHSIGGWAALAGAIVLGPRIGKYTKDGKSLPIPGHSIPLAALGVFILWLGWFGFNPGSTTAVGDGSFAYIAVTTNIAAATGAVGAMIASWFLFKKPDVSFALNGALAGLVSITAGCDIMSLPMASLTGLIGGLLVVFSCVFIDKLKIDDPVGAISVHGICGAWGTLAIGLFAKEVGFITSGSLKQLGIQATGVGAGFAWAFGASFAIFYAIKMTVGLRASEKDELEGLDVSEHGMHAYPAHQLVEV